MLEALKTVLITVACYGAALLIGCCIAWSIAWLLREDKPFWLQATTMLFLLVFFVGGIISVFTTPPELHYYPDSYTENGTDRYS